MADLHVAVTVADRGLDVDFTVAAGEVMALLGPNGAGKSTTAAVLAGLLQADHAVVRVGERVLTDTERGVAVAVHARRVGLLAQDPLLFPHLTVLGNVAFGIRDRRDRMDQARGWLDRVGADDLADRRPGELSGGQAQRVALARALAAEPDVLVLDEPLAGLDVAGAAAVRAPLRRGLADGVRPVVLITHDLLDVLALADRVLVLEDGRVAESGPVAGVLAAPRSRFGARFAGVNLVRGAMSGPGELRTGIAPASGQIWHGVPADDLPVQAAAVAVLQATTTALTCCSSRNSVMASERRTMKSTGLPP